MNCPKCKTTNRADARFCTNCGAALQPVCGRCGQPLPAGARFCSGCGATAGTAAPLPRDANRALLPGALLEGRYRVSRLLGLGGFGAVYLADDQRLQGRRCALKETFDTSPDARRQFEREASLLARLNHPRLVRVTDYFATPAGELFLVMDYVEGEDLDEVLARAGGPLPADQVVDWLLQVCDVVEYLHTWTDPATGRPSPVIHRDLKPANLKLRPDGTLMVIDLGIAKVKEAGQKTTRAAQAVSPPYSPLEQYGQGTDERSDLYALGVTLYHLLTGQAPADAPDLAYSAPPPPRQLNPALSPALEAAILKAMKPNPSERFQAVGEMRAALEGSKQQGASPSATLRTGSQGQVASGQRPAVAPARAPALPPTLSLAGMEFVLVPAGEFLMGSADDDPGTRDDEKPQHRVYLDAYYIGRYPVTNAQYKAFADATKRKLTCPPDKAKHPAVHINWDDAVAFCEWLSRQTGRQVRLPTEAEWEKAARGTDGRRYPWGDDPPDGDLCNFGGRVGDTTPVGAYSPAGDSPYGCADLAGNVWEWVSDWYEKGYYPHYSANNPQGPNSGNGRVLRGGSWYYDGDDVRVACRYHNSPTLRASFIGFRCAAVSQ